MTTRFYLDRRGAAGRPAPVKISISSKGFTAYIPTNIRVLPSQWDNRGQRIVGHPQKARLNNLLVRRKLDVDTGLYSLQSSGALHGLTAQQIKQRLLAFLEPEEEAGLFLPRLDAYAAKQGRPKTRELYELTAKKIRAYDRHAERLLFEEMDAEWLTEFDRWMASTCNKNSRAVHLRNIRAVFNKAIDDGVTDKYPFRKFKIRRQATRSRALSVDELRALFSADLGRHQIYADMFRLSFVLGGLSFCDLIALTDENIVRGRLEFRRQKTGQLVSIAIQPEARELLAKWHGETRIVCVAERYKDPHGFLRRMAAHLRRVGQVYDRRTGRWAGAAVAPGVSQYWARYSLATLAAELGFSEDAIGAVLGHSGNRSVTSIYIRANRNRQVDGVMRSVLDAVFGAAGSADDRSAAPPGDVPDVGKRVVPVRLLADEEGFAGGGRHLDRERAGAEFLDHE